jgi:hypothetical protein
VLRGLLPWLVFALAVAWAGRPVLAAGCAVGVAAASASADLVRRRTVKMLDLAAVAIFACLGGWALATGAVERAWVTEYGRAASMLALAVVMVCSTTRLPFTEQCAREQLPRQYWSSPLLRSVHARISLGWSGLVAATAAALLLGAWLVTRETPVLGFVLNWLLPAVLVLTATAQHWPGDVRRTSVPPL